MDEKTPVKDNKGNILNIDLNTPFNSLSPVSDIEKHKYYCDALEWALINRKEKDIKNIALTGNYGSGKSSILKTFQERHVEGLKFLKISLATFKEEKSKKPINEESEISDTIDDSDLSTASKNSSKPKKAGKILSKNDQLRLIELSMDKPGKLTHLRRMKLTMANGLPRFDLSLG